MGMTYALLTFGFKHVIQSQLLKDELYQAETPDLSQWLLYYISRPLRGIAGTDAQSRTDYGIFDASASLPALSITTKKKEIKSFADLLSHFPMIAKQLQSGMDNLYHQFAKSLEQTPTQGYSSSATTINDTSDMSIDSTLSAASLTLTRTLSRASTVLTTSQSHLRETLETLVLGAIDLFQAVDKQQLSLLGEHTELSGSAIERFIERHVTEHVHDALLFPRICATTQNEDVDVENHLKQMSDVDICQVGIADSGGFSGKLELSRRVTAAVVLFKKFGSSSSPQEMLGWLMETQQRLTTPISTGFMTSEKATFTAVNADTLVSLLLLVVIRSNVRFLNACLMYMRDFIFLSDVESGHEGYVISTFEAVLLYLSGNAKVLRKIGRTNRRLWHAAKTGNIGTIQAMLVPSASPIGQFDYDNSAIDGSDDEDHMDLALLEHDQHGSIPVLFQHASDNKAKSKKRVSMDTRSMSSSSEQSTLSVSSFAASVKSLISGEVSADQLAQTQDADGNSILFMAVERQQLKVLAYLLNLHSVITPELVMSCTTNEGSTLLAVAAQTGNSALIELILDYVLDNMNSNATLLDYLDRQDLSGRSVAHYCFNAPFLITSIGHLLPWRQRDKNGQTPLFAMCRSYDHESYRELTFAALEAAANYQGDGKLLQLSDHVDGKGNTLLHIVNDANLVQYVLLHCNADPNASNNKKFTPLMVASKFARLDLMRIFLTDARIDLQARDFRGLTAVEVAKDDEVRNRIDDMILLLSEPAFDRRRTTITRGLLVDDGSIRLVIKSGAPSAQETITVTTCRRSVADFQNLMHWLSIEQPASYIPTITDFRSPFQVSARPSKQVLRDTQLRLNGNLQELLAHPTFGKHEMLWEFFLVPDIDPRMLAERARRKAELRVENLVLDHFPLTSPADIQEVEIFTGHAMDQLHQVHAASKALTRRTIAIRNTCSDLAEAIQVAFKLFVLATPFTPASHLHALTAFATTLIPTEFSPATQLQYDLFAAINTSSSLLQSLARPNALVGSINSLRASALKHESALRRTQGWPSALSGLLETPRTDAASKAAKARGEMLALGRELRFTRQIVATELAGWQAHHAQTLRASLRKFAERTLSTEKIRLEGMQRAQRAMLLAKAEATAADVTAYSSQ